MSLLSSLKKRSTLDAAIKQVAEARKCEEGRAEQLYKSAYQGFATVIAGNLMFSEALYHWGFGLLHQARLMKSAEEATAVYENAISKFSFCLLTNPQYLGAAIDGGVAFMELARISPEEARAGMYGLAEDFFEKACNIQKGSAAYNLACVYALRAEEQACQKALEQAKEFGSLPDEADILHDPDLDNVKKTVWFNEFIEVLKAQPKAERVKLKDIEIDSEPKFKLKKSDEFDYYSSGK
ncbi:MAG: TPR end-of-group domain-containing protein [Gammaproteobacteria bacterium]